MENKKLLFVCLGNICRSPAAEGIMKKKVKEAGLENLIEIDSAGITGYHEGELPDQRMQVHAACRGYKLTSRSRPLKYDDFFEFDLIIGMDDSNIRHLMQKAPDPESQQKIRRMTDYCRKHANDHVPDPYYGGSNGFELVLDLLEDACDGLLEELTSYSPSNPGN
ncbi:MAG: low molecular weight phosphotyrosine protein phosphatase [Dysgonamonadaceae bacterium]|jgi:protein-tyrosine phosphatase|nr:low molecular weight phosphotyrosine protein phosphatase [Dysgonamonadaceae bacterium]